MLKQPRFKPHFRVQVVPGEGAFVLSDGKQSLLRGRLYELVAPQVQGRPAEDVCAQLEDHVSPAEVYFVLGQLEQKGYLCEQEESLPPGEAAFWSAQQIDPQTAARRFRETAVSVRALDVDPAPLCDLLRAMHVRIEYRAEWGVVLAADYLHPELPSYNSKALRTGRPWLLLRSVGRELWAGPLFRPGHTGCWECLALRLRANCPVQTYLDAKDRRPDALAAGAFTPATLNVGWGLAATAIATWIARGELPALEGKIQSFDPTSWQARAHTLVRVPYCTACGVREPVTNGWSGPAVLQSARKTFTQDGGHRVVSPEVTLQRHGHHISPITGAVTILERVGPVDDGTIHVYLAGHNLARRHRDLEHLRGDLRNMSSGKGASDVQARASGLCEGLERYSGVFRGDEPRLRARLRDLDGAGIHPNDCQLFSERQFRERDDWNARTSHYSFVPVPLDPDAEIEWTPAWSLTHSEKRLFPTAFCYFNYPHSPGERYCLACSNGNAAGNTLEEAILQGFFELVERDSVALWWYNRVRRPAVDLDSFGEPYFDRIRDFLHAQKRELWVLDLTSDLGIPVFAAISRLTAGSEERILLGFGCHLDASIALLRAVTEMNQMLASLLQGQGRDGLSEDVTDRETVHWLRTATVARESYLLPDDATARKRSAYPRSWADDLTEDVRACQALVEGQGMEMLFLDQTRLEIGLPVVKVIVPGLRHFWPRFAPGRLYDVPVRLGWLSCPLAEAELNPIPMFL